MKIFRTLNLLAASLLLCCACAENAQNTTQKEEPEPVKEEVKEERYVSLIKHDVDEDTTGNEPVLFIDGPIALDYGTVSDNKYAVFHHKIVLTNIGGGELEVEDIRSTCGCLKFDYERKALKHGESLEINMTLDKRGNNLVESTYTIRIYTNAIGKNPEIKVHINMVE